MIQLFNYKNSRTGLFLAILIGVSTSCKESWLTPEPLSFYSPENSFNDPEGLEATLVACEKNMRYEWHDDAPPILTESIFSDIAVEGTTDKSGPAQNMDLQITPDAQLNGDNYNRIGWYWYEEYKGIKYANVAISRIDQPKYESDAQKNDILGRAYFHRAYRYYRLTQQFGDVPLILNEITEPRLDFFSTKREVILQKMKEDLEFAEKYVYAVHDKGTVNKGAVSHLLTKVNLALGLFEDAVKSASNVIDGGTHRLMTTRFGVDQANVAKDVVWDLHRPENKSLPVNTEALMLVMDRLQMDGNEPDGTWIMRQAVPFWHNNINTPNGARGTIDTYGIEIDQNTNFGRGLGRMRPTWYSSDGIWDDNGDFRHKPGNWMRMEDLVYNNPSIKGKDSYYGKNLQLRNAAGALLTIDTIRCWFDWPHYKLYVPDPERLQEQGGHSDWYVFRLAETYLLRSEAYFWKGDLVNAAKDLNMVRQRANCKPYRADQIHIGTILDERARELYYEEPRKTELTRIAYILAMTGKPAYNGKSYNLTTFSESNFFYDRIMEKNNFYNKGVKTRHGDEYKMSPYHVLWPIPQSSINSNSRGVINQNKGYSGYERNVPALATIE